MGGRLGIIDSRQVAHGNCLVRNLTNTELSGSKIISSYFTSNSVCWFKKRGMSSISGIQTTCKIEHSLMQILKRPMAASIATLRTRRGNAVTLSLQLLQIPTEISILSARTCWCWKNHLCQEQEENFLDFLERS